MNQYTRIKEYQRRLTKNTLLSEVTKKISPTMQNADSREEVIQSVTNYVLAPALTGFVAWVLQQALEQGIKRLYFLARDGYFMYRTADLYVKEYELPVECRYLYCSRYSIRVPNYHLDTKKALEYITLGGLDVTAKKLYKRAGFDRDQRRKMYEEQILPMEKEEQIPRERLSEVKHLLADNKTFMNVLTENSYRAFPIYEQYLKQEGLLEDIPMALVDSGWVGSMQKELNHSLQQMGKKKPLVGFYWGLYELPEKTERRDYRTYFFSPEGEMKRKASFNNCLFESIFTAPHGMTLRYEQTGEKIVPILSELSEKRKKRLIFMEEIIDNWQKELLQSTRGVSFKNVSGELVSNKTLAIIEKNMELFMHHPTRAEAYAFGELEFTDDILEYKGNQIATKLEEKELTQNHLVGRVLVELTGNKSHIRQSAWYEGSATMYGKNPEYHIFHYSCYKYLMNYRKRAIWRQKYGTN